MSIRVESKKYFVLLFIENNLLYLWRLIIHKSKHF